MIRTLELSIEAICDADLNDKRRKEISLAQMQRYGRHIAEHEVLENEEAACCDQTASKYAERG